MYYSHNQMNEHINEDAYLSGSVTVSCNGQKITFGDFMPNAETGLFEQYKDGVLCTVEKNNSDKLSPSFDCTCEIINDALKFHPY
ncbi:hypothetical protein [Aeromonas veronii]|uniref:hypothetical protein n=1 Tax=Aeromonas veronii TaxID=654 RepID=UPI0032EF679E